MPFKANPAGLAALRARLTDVALQGAQAGAEVLRDKLDGEGTGVHYAGLPRRSSAAGEYPSRQSGELQRSITAEPDGELRAKFGPLNDPPAYVVPLHFRPPDAGGRPILDYALSDSDVRDAIKRKVGAK